jgi:hypothetical protein
MSGTSMNTSQGWLATHWEGALVALLAIVALAAISLRSLVWFLALSD